MDCDSHSGNLNITFQGPGKLCWLTCLLLVSLLNQTLEQVSEKAMVCNYFKDHKRLRSYSGLLYPMFYLPISIEAWAEVQAIQVCWLHSVVKGSASPKMISESKNPKSHKNVLLFHSKHQDLLDFKTRSLSNGLITNNYFQLIFNRLFPMNED